MPLTPQQVEALENIKRATSVDANLARCLPDSHPTYAMLPNSDREVVVRGTIDEATRLAAGLLIDGNPEKLDFRLVISGIQQSRDIRSYFRVVITGRKEVRKKLESQIDNKVSSALETFFSQQGITVDRKRIEKVSKEIGLGVSKILLDNRINLDNFQELSVQVS
jgi:hypothetical protein